MTDETDDLDRHLARLFEQGRRREDPEDHPSPEELSAYRANELPSEKADEIQEHLTQCRVCTGLLLDLERFLEPGEEEEPREGVADFGAEAGWRELRWGMGGVVPDKAPDTQPVEVARLRRSLRMFQSLAAVLFVALGLLASYVWLVRPAGRGPDLNAQVVTLASLKGVRGDGEIKKVALKRGTGDLTLVLGAPESNYPRYRLDLQDPQGQVRTYPGLEKDGNDFSLSLSREALSAGTYQIRVYGLEQGTQHLVGEYELELLRP